MPQSVSRPKGKEENKISVFVAQSLLPTPLAFFGPTQCHSTVVEDPAPSTHTQPSLWAATPKQQLPMLGRQHLLTGSSTALGRGLDSGRDCTACPSQTPICIQPWFTFAVHLHRLPHFPACL